MKGYLCTSKRLGFRNWIETDIPKMIAISGDEEVMRYFPAVAAPQQTTNFIHRMQEHFVTHGLCYFAVEILETKELIGFIGMMKQEYEAPFTPCIDIGWRLAKKHWGKDYATEGAKACLKHAFNTLGLKEVVATAPMVNLPSLHVMQKIGMQKKLEFIHPRLKGNKVLEECVCYVVSYSE